jgi:hypothetical protein
MVFDANIDAKGDHTNHSNHHTEVSLVSKLQFLQGVCHSEKNNNETNKQANKQTKEQ